MKNFDSTTKAICPKCNGDKKNDTGWENLGHSRGSIRTYEDCDLCEGEGVVLKITTYRTLNISEDQKPANQSPAEIIDPLSEYYRNSVKVALSAMQNAGKALRKERMALRKKYDL